jgi:hypothetical protein
MVDMNASTLIGYWEGENWQEYGTADGYMGV